VNLLHQGIVDTFGSVGATSGVHTFISVNTSDSVLQLRVAVDANNVGMADLRIPARHQDQRDERRSHFRFRQCLGQRADPRATRRLPGLFNKLSANA
jgi:hypothetical protein